MKLIQNNSDNTTGVQTINSITYCHWITITNGQLYVQVNVEEGGTASISTNEVSAYDPDTDQSSLTFAIDALPSHGTLWNENEQLSVGSQFTLTHLMLPTIRSVKID